MNASPTSGRLRRRDVLMTGVASAPLLAFAGLVWVERDRFPTELAWHEPSSGFTTFLCDAVIPRTTTGGATEAGVPAFMAMALGSGLFGGDGSTIGLLEAELDALAGRGGFMGQPARARLERLERLDADTFSRPPPPPPQATSSHAPDAKRSVPVAPAEPQINRLWRIIKSAIVTSYYTSEIGGSKELHYQLVPGRFDADILRGSVPYLSNYQLENVF